jgi:hypothetical protein
LRRHPVDESSFWAGYWRGLCHDDDRKNLTGTLLIHRRHLYTVNGYHERLCMYGHEDDDLYDRLVSVSHLQRRDVDLSCLHHIPHSDAKRYENLMIAPSLRDTCAEESSRRYYLIQASERLAQESPWTTIDRMTSWRVRPAGLRLLDCEVCEEPCRDHCDLDCWRSQQIR